MLTWIQTSQPIQVPILVSLSSIGKRLQHLSNTEAIAPLSATLAPRALPRQVGNRPVEQLIGNRNRIRRTLNNLASLLGQHGRIGRGTGCFT